MNEKLNDAIDELANEIEGGMLLACTMPDKLLRTVTKELIVNREKLYKIKTWCESYSLDVFPEPDFGQAHHVLKDIQEIING